MTAPASPYGAPQPPYGAPQHPYGAPLAPRNTVGIVAIVLVGLGVALSLVQTVVPALVRTTALLPAALGVTGVAQLIVNLSAAILAIIGLRHPRKALPAIALGFAVMALISFALWSGVLPILLPSLLG
ncbi:hypothetical protein [Microbacterium marinilacus]|uniref:MFS transporter n=1 Tax=Microbacterium marinilacus TaxID=415209 RepID=A0ABP7BL27_9MICO|nr:hypothetical protein [Microbacterium marinilacus]MBY0689664.1 hypothetical protein [Microbacterium marinilacus]